MEVTEVRIKLIGEGGDRLKAFCSITFDHCFVIRDLKIIEGTNGPFVAMPSRKLTSHCTECGSKNHLRAAYCNQCGNGLKKDRTSKDEDGRTKLYADIAHPINTNCREMIQARVVEEYQLELERSQKPGYVSRYDDVEFDTPEPHFQPHRGTPPPSSEMPSGDRQSRRENAHEENTGPPPSASHPPSRKAAAPSNGGEGFGDGVF